MYQNQSQTYNYPIQNTGESDIRVHLYKNDTLHHNAGNTLSTYNNIGSGITGLYSTQKEILLVNNTLNAITVYNIEEQAITDTITIHDKPFGITFDGEYYWVGSKSGTVYAYNTDWTSAELSFDLPETAFHSLTWNGECFLVTNLAKTNPHIRQISTTGELLGYYTTNIDMGIWQTTWVENHRDGKLWITNNNGVIAQLYLDGNIYKMRNSFSAPASISYSLGHDGKNIIYAKVSDQMYALDDNISEVNWLKITPLHDTIAAGGNTKNIALTFNAIDKAPGNYLAKITLENNDPDNNIIEVDAVMEVKEYLFAAQITNDTIVCSSSPFTLQCNTTGNVGEANYLWSSIPEGFSSSEQNPVIIPQHDITYNVKINDDISEIEKTVNISVIPSPQIELGNDTSLCENHTININLDNTYDEYHWFDGSMNNTITIDSTILDDGDNNVWVSVTGTNGCITTDTIIVSRHNCSGLEEISPSQIKIYPNPSNGKTKILLPHNYKNITVKIYNETGKEINSNNNTIYQNVSTIPLDLTSFKKGTYIISINNNNNVITKKIIIM